MKELEGKDTGKAKAKQATYNAGMNKIAQSLITQLLDIAQAFCLKLWGEALNVAGVDANSDLRGSSSIYYPPAHRISPSLTPLVLGSTSTPSTL